MNVEMSSSLSLNIEAVIFKSLSILLKATRDIMFEIVDFQSKI